MSSAWGQSARLPWRPELTYYEERIAALRSIEEQGLLSAFRLRDSEETGALIRTTGGEGEVTFSSRGLVVRLDGPGADLEPVLRAADIVLDKLRPRRLGEPSFSFRHLVPIPQLALDVALGRAIEAVLPVEPPASMRISDFANLLDGVHSDPRATFQSEYGVVSDDEIPLRLSSELNRVGGDMRGLPRDLAVELPKVAFFTGTSWDVLDRPEPGSVSDALRSLWARLLSSSDALASTLSRHVLRLEKDSEP